MSKLLVSDIQAGSMINNLSISSSVDGICYVLRSSFTLKGGNIVRVTIDGKGSIGRMDFCIRRATGDYVSHILYDFTIAIFTKYLKKMMSDYIKNISKGIDIDDYEILNMINKIRKNYLNATPMLIL